MAERLQKPKHVKGLIPLAALRRRSSAVHLLRLWVRIPRGAWRFVCCGCCVLSGRGLCDKLITHPEESYSVVQQCVCSRNLKNEGALVHDGPQCKKEKEKKRKEKAVQESGHGPVLNYYPRI